MRDEFNSRVKRSRTHPPSKAFSNAIAVDETLAVCDSFLTFIALDVLTLALGTLRSRQNPLAELVHCF
jgi:hypothetical protein